MLAENRKYHFDMLNTLDYQIMQSKLQQASFGGVLYNKQATVLVTYPAGKNYQVYKLPETVKCIEIGRAHV